HRYCSTCRGRYSRNSIRRDGSATEGRKKIHHAFEVSRLRRHRDTRPRRSHPSLSEPTVPSKNPRVLDPFCRPPRNEHRQAGGKIGRAVTASGLGLWVFGFLPTDKKGPA